MSCENQEHKTALYLLGHFPTSCFPHISEWVSFHRSKSFIVWYWKKMEPLLTAHYFEMTLSISIKILHVKIWTSYSALVYITCMSHTWGLNQNNILNPVSPNGDQHQFSPTISICCPEKRLWELIEWSLKRKCFDLLSKSLNYCNSLRKCMKIIMENYYVDIGTKRVNEYLKKQEIQLDGCKLVGCYQKLPRPCTLVSHTWPFSSCFTTHFSVPNHVRKSPIFQGVEVSQVQHSTRQGNIYWSQNVAACSTSVEQCIIHVRPCWMLLNRERVYSLHSTSCNKLNNRRCNVFSSTMFNSMSIFFPFFLGQTMFYKFSEKKLQCSSQSAPLRESHKDQEMAPTKSIQGPFWPFPFLIAWA